MLVTLELDLNLGPRASEANPLTLTQLADTPKTSLSKYISFMFNSLCMNNCVWCTEKCLGYIALIPYTFSSSVCGVISSGTLLGTLIEE